MDSTFAEVASILLIATVAGMIAVKLRQPLIIAFIVVGILVGPSGVGLITAHEEIELLAGLGITILLFLVGLKLDVRLVRNLGPVAVATGLGQLAFTIAGGYLLALVLGLDSLTALYVAVALTFSSTIIIVKLLSDKKEIDSLHGRIAMGFLIVQDIAVVVAMAVLGTIRAGTDDTGTTALLRIPLVAAATAVAVPLIMRYVLPAVLRVLARSTELLLVFALAWGTLLATGADALGFSRELGAFLAGFMLASTGYRETIGARLVSLRDVLVLFFFVDLGAQLQFEGVRHTVGQATVLSVFILIGNPLIVMLIMGVLGYRKRTGFLAGLTVAQISEFSLIFLAFGVTLGHVTDQALALVTVIGLVTITASTYLILYSHRLYDRLEHWLGVFERRDPARERRFDEQRMAERQVDAVVFGLGRFGRQIIRRLQDAGWHVVGVDFDPDAVSASESQGLHAIYGDAADPEFPKHLPLERIRWMVCTIPDRDTNLVLLHSLGAEGYAGSVAANTHLSADIPSLRAAGATLVLEPFSDAAHMAARLITGAEATVTGHLPSPYDDAG